MNFIDRLAGQARTAEQAIREFKPPEAKPVLPSTTQPTVEPTIYRPSTLEDSLMSRKASGIGEMVKRLGLVLAADMVAGEYKGTTVTFSRGASFGPDYEIERVDHPMYSIDRRDLKMGISLVARRYTAIDQVSWHKVDQNGRVEGELLVGVFSYPDGCIGFLGSNYEKPETIDKKQWSNDPDLIVQTLGRYFEKDYGSAYAYSEFAKAQQERENDDVARYYGVGRYSRSSLSSNQRGPWR